MSRFLSNIFRKMLKMEKPLMVLIWVVVISAILINAYLSIYFENIRFRRYKLIFSIYENPTLNPLDILSLLFASLIVGLVLSDLKTLFISYILSTIISLTLSILVCFCFIWYSLNLEGVLSAVPYGWEWGLYAVILNTFRLSFPLVYVVTLVGAMFGILIRNYLFYS